MASNKIICCEHFLSVKHAPRAHQIVYTQVYVLYLRWIIIIQMDHFVSYRDLLTAKREVNLFRGFGRRIETMFTSISI